MNTAVRAIIIENNKLLVMRRDKHGSEYYTLVGGRVDDNESLDDALSREVMEETGLVVTSSQLVFIEKHQPPYNEQYIYLCGIAPNEAIGLQNGSEEGLMNRIGINNHYPEWCEASSFSKIPFRTPQLQISINEALSSGFPDQPITL
jgi:ADP-ribose pyrophosphatase YjhB (NUDIX family)